MIVLFKKFRYTYSKICVYKFFISHYLDGEQ